MIAASVAIWPIRRAGDILALRFWGGSEDVRALCRLLGGAMMLVLVMVLGALLDGVLWSWGVLAVFPGLPALFFLHVYWQDRTIGAWASVHSFFLLAGAKEAGVSFRRTGSIVARPRQEGRSHEPPSEARALRRFAEQRGQVSVGVHSTQSRAPHSQVCYSVATRPGRPGRQGAERWSRSSTGPYWRPRSKRAA